MKPFDLPPANQSDQQAASENEIVDLPPVPSRTVYQEQVQAITPEMLRRAAASRRPASPPLEIPDEIVLAPLPPRSSLEENRAVRRALRGDNTWNPLEGKTPVPGTAPQAEQRNREPSLAAQVMAEFLAKKGPSQNLLRGLPENSAAKREFLRQMQLAAANAILTARQDQEQARIILSQHAETIATGVIRNPKFRDEILG